jgi:DNA-binding GntR family transcriptional regulator
MKRKSSIFPNFEAPPSLKELAFQSIKDAIFANRLKPGETYTEQGVASELGVSKSPVREALIDLSARSFLRIIPRTGFRVNILTKDLVRDLFEFRIALEKAVILHITSELTNDSIKEIQFNLRKNKKASETDDLAGILRVDREFHSYLASLTGNQYIILALENVRDLIDWAGAKIVSLKGRQVEALNEHTAITKMLEERNVQEAVAKMEEHLLITQDRILDLVID